MRIDTEVKYAYLEEYVIKHDVNDLDSWCTYSHESPDSLNENTGLLEYVLKLFARNTNEKTGC